MDNQSGLNLPSQYNDSHSTNDEDKIIIDPTSDDEHYSDNYDYYYYYYYEDPIVQEILNISYYYLIPILTIIGLVGNISCIYVILKHGLQKSSNILLFSLALMDTMYLLGNVNVGEFIYYEGSYQGFPAPYSLAMFAYVLYILAIGMYFVGHWGSTVIPVLITLERLVAVFLPLKFKSIVTPRRVWTIVICVCAVGIASPPINTPCYVNFDYMHANNTFYGLLAYSSICDDWKLISLLLDIILQLEGSLSYSFVVIGCVLISVKVKMSVMKRKKSMNVSRASYTNKTTLTLLAICLVYVLCGFPYVIMNYIPMPVTTFYALTYIINVFLTINSACNFIIYIIMNEKFRKTYVSLFQFQCK